MIDKDFVFTEFGNSRILSISTKTAYFSKRQRIDKDFFNDSFAICFFLYQWDRSVRKELEELKKNSG
jgi:hypothetical protein